MNGGEKTRDLKLRSINQVFTYCRRANVQYGYIVTQEELVVTRPFWGDKNEPDNLNGEAVKRLYLEYKAKPWAENGDNGLTINLMLWCLHMLAARKKPIGGREQSTIGISALYPVRAREYIGVGSTRSDKIHHSFKRSWSETLGLDSEASSKRTKRLKN